MAEKYEDMLSKLGSDPVWSEREEAVILEPYTYLIATKGKEIRMKLIEAFNLWLGVSEEKLQVIRKIVSMFHSSSLMIDDVEDDSQLRRGIPVAHKVFGVPQTINSANYIYFLALQETHKLSSTLSQAKVTREGLYHMVVEEMLNLHRGQGLELLWRDSLTVPTEEEYVGMVNNKTGGLFRMAIKLMMSQSSSTVDYTPLVNLIGVFFQIRDDYMNLRSDEYAQNKSFAEDLTEGKFSFPIVHAIRTEKGRQVLNVVQKRPTTPTMKTYIISYMDETTGSFAYTRTVLESLEKQTRAEIARLGGNKMLEGIIDALKVSQ